MSDSLTKDECRSRSKGSDCGSSDADVNLGQTVDSRGLDLHMNFFFFFNDTALP